MKEDFDEMKKQQHLQILRAKLILDRDRIGNETQIVLDTFRRIITVIEFAVRCRHFLPISRAPVSPGAQS